MYVFVCVMCLSVSEQVCLLLTVTTNKEPPLYRTLSYIVVFEIKLYNNISAVRNVGSDQIPHTMLCNIKLKQKSHLICKTHLR